MEGCICGLDYILMGGMYYGAGAGNKDAKPKTIKVLEMDQFSSGHEIEKYNFKTFDPAKLRSDGAKAAQTIFGGHYTVRKVKPDDSPFIGEVWYRQEKGHFKLYKANYDSSD